MICSIPVAPKPDNTEPSSLTAKSSHFQLQPRWITLPTLPTRKGYYLVTSRNTVMIASFNTVQKQWFLAYCPDMELTISQWAFLPRAQPIPLWPPFMQDK